jgi:alanine racemase
MPTAHVDLSALVHNVDLLRARLKPGCQLMATVKARAYGHGAVPVARACEAAGVGGFGVATPGEALELRAGGITGRVLLLGPALAQVAELIEAGIDLSVTCGDDLRAIHLCGAAERARVHLKVDTGMGRVGLAPTGALDLARAVAEDRRVEFEGVFTHFAAADEADRSFTEMQIESFERLLCELERDSILPPQRHASNSAGLLAYPQAHYTMVRPGIVLYGYPPSAELANIEPRLKPAMSVSAPVTFVKRVAEGTPVSYGGSWRAPRETTVATVRFGYADGYPRRLANRGWASLRGERVEVAGRVCMDQLMLDVGDREVSRGERVVLLGSVGAARQGPDAAELGALAGTVSYEILTSISERVSRLYSG